MVNIAQKWGFNRNTKITRSVTSPSPRKCALCRDRVIQSRVRVPGSVHCAEIESFSHESESREVSTEQRWEITRSVTSRSPTKWACSRGGGNNSFSHESESQEVSTEQRWGNTKSTSCTQHVLTFNHITRLTTILVLFFIHEKRLKHINIRSQKSW